MFLQNCQDLITVQNENLVTTSLIVADVFNKRHTKVLEKIELLTSQIEDSPKSGCPQMFEKSEYITSQNKPQPMYYINRDGLSLLAMGFTGAEALKWKLKYIEAFNAMEQKLRSSAPAVSDNKSDVAKLIIKASRYQIQAIKELYPEYFVTIAPTCLLEKIVDKNTSYQKWIEDFGITLEWICNFPTLDIYNSYAQYCVDNRYKPMGKKVFYSTLSNDFGLTRKQMKDGYRYFLRA